MRSRLEFFDTIFLCGHSSLDYYATRKLIRPFDRVFTILREPIEIALSHVNYVLTRIKGDIEVRKIGPDTSEWLSLLGFDTLPPGLPPAMVQRLSTAILRSPALVKPNSMCFWLGGADAESAIGGLIGNDVEITTTEEYDNWLRHRWNVQTNTRLNRSDPFVSLETLRHEDIAYIQEITAEDKKLFSRVTTALSQAGRSFVTGQELIY